jgi:putative nucleotidyltransferase with HDIG domain
MTVNSISNFASENAADLKKEMERRGSALSALSEAAAALARAESTDMLVQEVCSAIASQTPYVLAWVGRAEDDTAKTVNIMGGAGSAIAYTKEIFISWSDQVPEGLGPAGACLRSGKTTFVTDSETDKEFLPWRERARTYGIRSAIACPIQDGSEHLRRCLLVYSSEPHSFGSTEVELFQSLAHEIGFGLRSIERQRQLDIQIHEKQLTQERLTSSLRSTIEAMSRTMEWRDPYTAGHQKRVALIAMRIADKLGWKNEDAQALYMAGMVHDIGKVAVPSEILTKPTRLTDLEMKMVQGHVEAGYQILKDIPFPWPIAEAVYQHHERLDGSGYPNGLKGDQISQGGRILAVADTIEAMSTHRPYRPARGLAAAMDEISAESGAKLDATVVNAALDLLKEGNELQKIIESV